MYNALCRLDQIEIKALNDVVAGHVEFRPTLTCVCSSCGKDWSLLLGKSPDRRRLGAVYLPQIPTRGSPLHRALPRYPTLAFNHTT